MLTGNHRLMDAITVPENLLNAWRAVRGNIPRIRRDHSAGTDGVSIAEFERDLSVQLSTLRQALHSGRYQPKPAISFQLPKRSGGYREIAVFCVGDRVAQRAVQQVVEPLYEPGFLDCNYGFRPRRSVQDAVGKATALRKKGNRWVVDGDIEACFDSLDQELLMTWLQKRINENAVLDLFRKWLANGVVSSQSITSTLATGWGEEFSAQARKGVNVVTKLFKAQEGSDYGAAFDRDEENISEKAEHDASVNGGAFQASQFGYQCKESLRQAALYGLRAATGMVIPALARTLRSPVGRHHLANGALVAGGLAGVALGVSLVAPHLVRHVQPSDSTGVSQGSPLSPLLANIYLHPFDVHLIRSGKNLVRYADDWVILCPTEDDARQAYNEAVSALARIKLKLNLEKTQILSPSQPLEWLGLSIP